MAEFTITDGDLTTLRGKVIIVTGGSSGIGLATVELLLSLGAAVVSGDVQPPPAPQIIYPSTGVTAFFTYQQTDVTVWADLRRLFQRAVKVHGRVDHVFACAGVQSRSNDCASSLAIDADGELQEPSHAVLDCHLKGAMSTATLAIHHMRTQDFPGGSIVLNSFTADVQRFQGVDHAVTKEGILALGRGLTSSLNAAALPIRVNVLMPGRTKGEGIKDVAAARARPTSWLTSPGKAMSSMLARAVPRDRGAILLPAYREAVGEGAVDDN
ncbi:hypothetical protein PG994_009593 [Apiospora phragmitis]|uniref:SDR family oxidoreductase n=1 Tax=Apiospora phragmitis TaxID=2905665 RepID=A0ABR1U6K6_9PEZI